MHNQEREKLIKFFKIFSIIAIVFALIFGSLLFYFVKKNVENLPDYEQLRDYTPMITTRLYADDGALISEYSKEKRIFVSVENIPQNLKNAFIAAEDSNFYQNSGIDLFAIFRTAVKNVFSRLTGSEQLGGASTITQQVVKNFLLTRQKTFERKIKEAILAYQMTKTFSKDKILELYLNQIYLGSGAYGVAAAAQVYFDKSIEDLEIQEVALLATLPKAPSKLDPRKNIEKAKYRRDWVINRMIDEGFISQKEGNQAIEKPIILKDVNDANDYTKAHSFADNVKKELTKLYGSDNVFEEGIFVRTTLNSKMQEFANLALSNGIEDYDMRHGYRGAVARINIKDKTDEQIIAELKELKIDKIYKTNWKKAVITEIQKDFAKIIVEDSKIGILKLEDISWARKYIGVNAVGSQIKKVEDVVKISDVVLVQEKIAKEGENSEFLLKQVPEVNGAILVMDPHTGRILAMMGGYVDLPNQFNRATQAFRQPGSTMKTFGYLAALENGMTPASIIIDEPITLDQGEDLPPYNPTNYSGEFYGPTTLRRGLEKSQNVTTVRMANQIGLSKVVEVVKRLGVNDDPQHIYSLVLGSTETSLERLVKAYSIMINGGKKIESSTIEKIQDRDGKTIYRRDISNCQECKLQENEVAKSLPILPDLREKLIDEAVSYQITYMLQGVVERGTAWDVKKQIGKIIGGKTGTTNNSYDSWFVGFTPDLIVGVYIGFDTPKNLGDYETGASVAMPIFIDFMKNALKDTASTPFRVPASVKFVKIDRMNGKFPTPSTPQQNMFFEAFKIDDETDLLSESFDNDNISKDGFNKQKNNLEPSGIY